MAVDTLREVKAKIMDGAQPLDGDALARDLTALARSVGGDKAALRKAALEAIRAPFMAARAEVKTRMESGTTPGVAVARALSALQDTTIQVIFEFAVRYVYPAPNPTKSERLAVVATGGYGRGLLAPFSDVDLLFVRPFKETPWGESVIEFILHMLWDLGLKVGHATRSVAECIRLSNADVTIRTALLEARFLWADRAVFEDMRKKFWADVASRSGQDFVQS